MLFPPRAASGARPWGCRGRQAQVQGARRQQVVVADACPPCDPHAQSVTSHPPAPRRDLLPQPGFGRPRPWGGGPSSGASDTGWSKRSCAPGDAGRGLAKDQGEGQGAAGSEESGHRVASTPAQPAPFAGAFGGLRRPPAGLSGSTGTARPPACPPAGPGTGLGQVGFHGWVPACQALCFLPSS